MGRQASAGSWIAAGIVVLALAAAGTYLARRAMHPAAPAPVGTAVPAPAAPGSAASAIRHPIGQAAVPASPTTAALPALDPSDAGVATALLSLAGDDDLRGLLVNGQIVARIVATIDALPRRGLATFMLPLHPPRGSFITADAGGVTVLGAPNSERYAPYMRIVEAVDPQALVGWYVHAYPLFQQAYRQLGYPRGYFNDRLIVAIDDMLAAPQPQPPAPLVFANGYYRYRDPALESLSAGQKLLLRVGPANAATIKAKLRTIRARLTAGALPAAAGTSH